MILVAALIVALVAIPASQLEHRERWPIVHAMACALTFAGAAAACLEYQSGAFLPGFLPGFLSPSGALQVDAIAIYGGVAGCFATVILLAFAMPKGVHRLQRIVRSGAAR